ncbi:hypothetical protein [uncultured Shewanella sp.]|uniref:hypothetical protein n=1 Tax=uncultured Shewanella sp. TaxID=173975 RepID=UPI00263085D2|nr:hypothetical protein [uncultured Shewanella sp.]
MKRFILALTLILQFNYTYASNENTHKYKSCENNFTHKKTSTGEIFRTSDVVYHTNKLEAFKKVSKYIAMDGWNINNSDINIGMINASQDVPFSNGKVAPLNIFINNIEDAIEISISYSTSSGVYSPKDAVMNNFCKIITSAT